MSRSPGYPNRPLEDAVALAMRAYNDIGTSSVSSETFMEALGYKGKSGASLSAIATLRHFGLVDGRGDQVQISELFQKIFRPLNDQEQYESLLEAAKTPKLFAELFSEYDKLPSEKILESIAVRKFGFGETGAKKFATSITDTVEYIDKFRIFRNADESIESSQTSDELVSDLFYYKLQPEDKLQSLVSDTKAALLYNQQPKSFLKFQLSATSSAQVTFQGEITPAIIERLIKHLELTKDSYFED